MKPWERYNQGPWSKYGKSDPVRDFGEGANVGISRTLGAPVDAVNWALGAVGLDSDKPVGGSEWIQGGMESVGIPASESRGMAGAIGEGVGAGAVTLGVGGALAAPRAGAVLAGEAAPATSTAGRIVEDIATTAIKSPAAFTAAEMAASAGAGAGGYALERKYPDVPGVRVIGEIIGGMTPVSVGLTLRAVGSASPTVWAVKSARGLFDSLTRSGGKRRAGERLRRTVSDPDAIRTERDDVIDAPLTPAQRSEEPGLLSLERSVMDATDQLKSDRANQLAGVNAAIRGAFLEGEGTSEHASAYLKHLIDTRVRAAALRADEALSQTAPKVDREAANRIVRRELDAALRDVRDQETKLYRRIPLDTSVRTRASTLRFQRFWNETGMAQRGDIPPSARRFLNPESRSYLGADTNLREMRALQSKLREEARVARSAGEYNRARMADEMASAITEDIASAGGTDEVKTLVQEATRFSRDMNDVFTRGEVGKILGYDSSGVKVSEGTTLERLIGKSGPAAREGSDALREAALFADKHAGTQRAKDIKTHLNDYVLDSFNRSAVRDGQVDVPKAAAFLRENAELIKRHPDIGKKIQNAIETRKMAIDTERQFDPEVSAAGVFLKASPSKEIDRVLGMSDPRTAMNDLAALARTDPSGRALSGLKRSFMDRLLRQSESGSEDVTDALFVSGRKMSDEMRRANVQQAMEGLFTPEELARIEKIRRTAIILDKTRAAPPSDEGVIGDAPGYLTSVFGRVFGAQMGREVAVATGGGTVQTPGIFSGTFQKILHAGINDPARRLLNDAIQDESLFRTLMSSIQTPAQQEAAVKRLNAWASSVLQEMGYPEETEQ